MQSDWSAQWCSLDRLHGLDHLIFTDDGSAAGLARAHCIVETAERCFAVSVQGAGGDHSGFWKCPASDCLVVLFENAVVAVDLKNPALHAVVDVPWVAGEPIVSARYVVLWSFWAVTLIVSATDITETRFDDADIEAVTLHHHPERLELRMFVASETVERTLLL